MPLTSGEGEGTWQSHPAGRSVQLKFKSIWRFYRHLGKDHPGAQLRPRARTKGCQTLKTGLCQASWQGPSQHSNGAWMGLLEVSWRFGEEEVPLRLLTCGLKTAIMFISAFFPSGLILCIHNAFLFSRNYRTNGCFINTLIWYNFKWNQTCTVQPWPQRALKYPIWKGQVSPKQYKVQPLWCQDKCLTFSSFGSMPFMCFLELTQWFIHLLVLAR